MKKNIIKVTAFVVIFVLLFAGAQSVLHYRWSNPENLYTRNLDLQKHPKDSIDVLMFGTSEMYAAYIPVVAYDEAGFTGYNLATSWKSGFTTYYQLKYALKYQKPKVVVCDFASLYYDSMPDTQEQLYRKVVDSIPDKEIRNEMIKEICKLDPEQTYLSWKLPLFRYHDMWSELTEDNFKKDYVFNPNYLEYSKGAELLMAEYADEPMTIDEEHFNPNGIEYTLSDYSVKYYDMFIKECQDNGITVIAMQPPKIGFATYTSQMWAQAQDYFNSRGVVNINYNTYDECLRMGFDDVEANYYDAAHLNTEGAITFSREFAKDLSDLCDLPDHRGDSEYKDMWDDMYQQFEAEQPIYPEEQSEDELEEE